MLQVLVFLLLWEIVGPTGVGKTTLLNVIAGVTNYAGSVFIGDVCVDKVSPGKRGAGYLIQGLALFPHLTVESNIAFGLKALNMKQEDIFISNVMPSGPALNRVLCLVHMGILISSVEDNGDTFNGLCQYISYNPNTCINPLQ